MVYKAVFSSSAKKMQSPGHNLLKPYLETQRKITPRLS